jgi:hypothetical protein
MGNTACRQADDADPRRWQLAPAMQHGAYGTGSPLLCGLNTMLHSARRWCTPLAASCAAQPRPVSSVAYQPPCAFPMGCSVLSWGVPGDWPCRAQSLPVKIQRLGDGGAVRRPTYFMMSGRFSPLTCSVSASRQPTATQHAGALFCGLGQPGGVFRGGCCRRLQFHDASFG